MYSFVQEVTYYRIFIVLARSVCATLSRCVFLEDVLNSISL